MNYIYVKPDFPAPQSAVDIADSYGTTVVVSWLQPTPSIGQGAVTNFKIQYGVEGKPSTTSEITAASNVRSMILTRLLWSSSYIVTITPVNRLAAGPGVSTTFNTTGSFHLIFQMTSPFPTKRVSERLYRQNNYKINCLYFFTIRLNLSYI